MTEKKMKDGEVIHITGGEFVGGREGTHPDAPGEWLVSTEKGWVGFWAGPSGLAWERPGMFSPDEAREIAAALIEMADQEQRRR